MLDSVTLVSAITGFFGIAQSIKEKKEPIAPPIYNFDLYRKDILSGCSTNQLYKYQHKGRYKKPDIIEPHRNSNGQIIIEDMERYRTDAAKYGVVQAQKWIREGRYNR